MTALDLAEQFVLLFCDDRVRAGKRIRFLHRAGILALVIVFVVAHTALPSLILLVALWLVIVAIWIHHLVFGGCVLSKIEQRLLGDTSSFIDPVLEFFDIPVTPETAAGIVVMGSTALVVCMGFSIAGRVSAKLMGY